jgi:hypothetical protein
MEKIEIIGIAVGIVAAVLGGTWVILKLMFNIGERSNRFCSMEKTIGDLPCAAHSEELIKSGTILDSMKKSLEKLPCDTHSEELIKSRTILDTVAKTVDKLENSIKYLPCAAHDSSIGKIQTFLIQKYPTAAVALGAKASPRRLNEQGLKVFEDIDGDDFLKEHKEHLFGYITRNNPLTELDVEQLAFAACQSLTITPVFNKLKRYVYNASPIELADGKKYELDLSDICFTLSIPLRDMYLSEIGIKEETE